MDLLFYFPYDYGQDFFFYTYEKTKIILVDVSFS